MADKPSLMVLLGRKAEDSETDADAEDSPTKGELTAHMHNAAEDMISAVHNKDAGGVVSSMKALHDLCAAHADAPEDEDEGELEKDEGHSVDDESAEEEAAGTDSP